MIFSFFTSENCRTFEWLLTFPWVSFITECVISKFQTPETSLLVHKTSIEGMHFVREKELLWYQNYWGLLKVLLSISYTFCFTISGWSNVVRLHYMMWLILLNELMKMVRYEALLEHEHKILLIIWARSCENVSYAICEPQRRRSACASAQSDQRLCCSLLG